MPELPEVETVRRGLEKVTLNQEITGGDVLLSRTIAYPFSEHEFLAGLSKNAISNWQRQGKYLLAQLSNSSHLGVHLRMTGQLLWLHPSEPLHKHTRVRLFFAGDRELRFVDQRTFGQMWWIPKGQATSSVITGLAKLGLDPFSSEFSPKYLAAKLINSRRSIKSALLDQAIIAGIGNIYADEALFIAKIFPATLSNCLQIEQLTELRTAIIQVLEASIAAGGTTFSDFLNVEGINGNYGGVAWVYNRTGKPCRICGTPIEKIKLAGRSSHFCPQCQGKS
ncbi:DNA-formamidopyrimidine glycosylase [Synechocystis sp. PCC 7509]|uniref:DNA-formamidopyrimidine glycosylase n=1 Tax=Synechocystis sp. PCC 7509 TaxID=927677 RepID=UPI0002ACCC74|nr:DNA-formamidopyrimidine glycosylase [Synechocystis sp. PCC 7509]